jgi:hypothetical protein
MTELYAKRIVSDVEVRGVEVYARAMEAEE